MLSCSGPGLVSNAHTKLVDICSPDLADTAGQPLLGSAQSPARSLFTTGFVSPFLFYASLHSGHSRLMKCNACQTHPNVIFMCCSYLLARPVNSLVWPEAA